MFLFQSQFHSVIGLFIKLIRSPSPVNKLSLSFYTSLPAENIEFYYTE